jgi:hypothetical protein
MSQYVEWSDPYPGLDENGVDVTVPVTLRMLATDAVKYQHKCHDMMKHHGKWKPLSNLELLDEFIVIHWATIKEVE